MQTPLKSPAGRSCQYIDSETGEQCGKPLPGRGPHKWCAIHRKENRRVKNSHYQRKRQEKLRINKDQRPSIFYPALWYWQSFCHRRKQGRKIKSEGFFYIFTTLYTDFPFLRKVLSSLQGLRITWEVYPATIDFHVCVPDGKRLFTFTRFGLNSLGHFLGVDYGVELGEDEELNAQMSEALRRRRHKVTYPIGYRIKFFARFTDESQPLEIWLSEDDPLQRETNKFAVKTWREFIFPLKDSFHFTLRNWTKEERPTKEFVTMVVSYMFRVTFFKEGRLTIDDDDFFPGDGYEWLMKGWALWICAHQREIIQSANASLIPFAYPEPVALDWDLITNSDLTPWP